MSESSGTVIAAAIAFVAAIIGAVIAGLYAKRAAQTGGRKAVEAALAQVHGQAAAEHWQWVRGQRHHAFVELLTAFVALDQLFIQIAPGARNGVALDDAATRELQERALEVRATASKLMLCGPRDADALAYTLTRACMASVGYFLQAAGARTAGEVPDWSEFDRARDEMTHAHAAFLQRAGEIIRDPLQSVS